MAGPRLVDPEPLNLGLVDQGLSNPGLDIGDAG